MVRISAHSGGRAAQTALISDANPSTASPPRGPNPPPPCRDLSAWETDIEQMKRSRQRRAASPPLFISKLPGLTRLSEAEVEETFASSPQQPGASGVTDVSTVMQISVGCCGLHRLHYTTATAGVWGGGVESKSC